MKKLGLIGGMSVESTKLYYDHLNRMVNERLGGQHNAKTIIESVDFAEIEDCQQRGDWARAEKILVETAQCLVRGGAEALILCTNTMHKVSDGLENLAVPFIHIADTTGQKIQGLGLERPLLLGTRYTMEQDFYKGRLSARYGIDVKIPTDADRTIIHNIIFDELCHGIEKPDSKAQYLNIIDKHLHDVDCVILGCTEIGMLIKQSDLSVPVLDTTKIHAEAAIDYAFGGISYRSFKPSVAQAGVS